MLRNLIPYTNNNYKISPAFSELERSFNRLFDFDLPQKLFDTPVDLYETEDKVTLEVGFPGIPQENWDIELTENTIKISGKREEKAEDDKAVYHRKSYSSREFSTYIDLPAKVDANTADASYVDGILKIQLDKLKSVPGTTKLVVK